LRSPWTPRPIVATTTAPVAPTTVQTTAPTALTTITAAPKAVPAARSVPAPASPPTTTRPPTPAPLLVTRLDGVDGATQVIAVSASGYGVTTATFSAYQETSSGWEQVFGPWMAHVGYNGFAPPGQKREGDGRTPSGSFGFDFFFGVLGDPGVSFPYRAVTGPDIVWDDDPSSPLYNQWVDTADQDAGASPEPMDEAPAYDYGAVIAYNTAPVVAGVGSAIFLHVTTGAPTSGCVSLPMPELLSVLRWLQPSALPRIIMGTAATITS
jgi:L,D-peptidoglycan transpeptidase YkuD (ErfK/YbiS/YcfS/YnhG family)